MADVTAMRFNQTYILKLINSASEITSNKTQIIKWKEEKQEATVIKQN